MINKMDKLRDDISDALKGCILYPGEGHAIKIMPYALIQRGYQLIANVLAPNKHGGEDQVIIISDGEKVERYLYFALGKYSKYKRKPLQKREFFVALPTEAAPTPRDIILIMDGSVLYTRTKGGGGGMLQYHNGRIKLFDDPEYNLFGTFTQVRIGIMHDRVAEALHFSGIETIVQEDLILKKMR